MTDKLQAQAMFRNHAIDVKGHQFQSVNSKTKAYEQLLDFVEQYFSKAPSTSEVETSSKVAITTRPPIYLQRPRHSMTIVGIEIRQNRMRNLLVFDPAYTPSKTMISDPSAQVSGRHVERFLKIHRRDERYLKRYAAFEALTVGSQVLESSQEGMTSSWKRPEFQSEAGTI